MTSGQNVIDKNEAWLSRVKGNAKQARFVEQMINTITSLVVTPYLEEFYGIRYDMHDFCYVIVAYNSDVPKMYDGKRPFMAQCTAVGMVSRPKKSA